MDYDHEYESDGNSYYWESVMENHGWEYCDALEQLHKSLMAATSALVAADEDASEPIDIEIGHVRNRNTIEWRCLMHCPSLTKFADALRDYPEDRVIRSLKLRGIELKRGVLDAIKASNLPTKHLLSLDIDSIDHGIAYVAEILEGNRVLETLKLRGASFGSDSTSRFADAARDHPALSSVSFDNCGWWSVERFSLVMNGAKDKESLLLGGDYEYGVQGIYLLPGILAANPMLNNITLKSTNMQRNTNPAKRKSDPRQNDYALVYKDLAEALTRNTNMRKITIRDDIIPKEGVAALWKAMYNDESLNTIVASNHTCIIHYEDKYLHQPFLWTSRSMIANKPRDDELTPPGWIQGSTDFSKRSKLLYALGARTNGHINLNYLNDVPLGVMPKVLHFVQYADGLVTQAQSVDTAISLKNVFEVLKNCVAPLLCTGVTEKTLKRKRDEAVKGEVVGEC